MDIPIGLTAGFAFAATGTQVEPSRSYSVRVALARRSSLGPVFFGLESQKQKFDAESD